MYGYCTFRGNTFRVSNRSTMSHIEILTQEGTWEITYDDRLDRALRDALSLLAVGLESEAARLPSDPTA